MSNSDYGWLRSLANVSSIGLLILIATVIGMLIGLWLDKVFHTSPWLVFIFTLIGLTAGIVEAIKIVLKAGQ